MKLPTIRGIMNRIRSKLKRKPDRFLQKISGVIHVGANIGQERDLYDKFDLRVIWIEPIPEVFETLNTNLRGFSNQHAFQCLITDREDEEYKFHISNNNGASSSILDLKHHKDIWPDVNYTNTIFLRSTTLASLFERERIDSSNYQALIIDTQGSELLVLKGSIPLLHSFTYIKIEVPDFESYASCCQLADINSFMTQHGYKEFSRQKFASRTEGGSYFDVTYKKKA
jgi:FkbM family methyltransferase